MGLSYSSLKLKCMIAKTHDQGGIIRLFGKNVNKKGNPKVPFSLQFGYKARLPREVQRIRLRGRSPQIPQRSYRRLRLLYLCRVTPFHLLEFSILATYP